MLWYKSWRETRTTVLLGMAAMAMACVAICYYQQTMRDHADHPMTYAHYIWKSVYSSIGRDLFLILAVILGSGGLLQEKANGTSGFTLTLPVSRRGIVFSRALMGYCGVIAIAAVPVLVLPLASYWQGQMYPMEQTLRFALLWIGVGTVFYGFTFLLAHHIEGDYISVLVAIPSLMIYGVLLNLPWLARFRMLDIFDLINGDEMPFFDEARHVLTGPMPWFALVAIVLTSLAFVEIASRSVQRREF
ncbi:MAG: ABC transporter permease [Acidobacteria bacterium]|nr:ABC transporter permease [Acidobacteriota bacterium]